MAKPAHTKRIAITRRTEPATASQDKDSKRFRLRLVNDHKRAEIEDAKRLKEVWEL